MAIPPLYIQRELPPLYVIMQYFLMSPNNGCPSLPPLFTGDYKVSFIPSTTIPKYGIIQVVFPPSEFT
jgi:hypothetical protein